MAVNNESLEHTQKRTWSQNCCSFHAIKALALPGKSKRATLKAPGYVFIYNTIIVSKIFEANEG